MKTTSRGGSPKTKAMSSTNSRGASPKTKAKSIIVDSTNSGGASPKTRAMKDQGIDDKTIAKHI